MRYTISIRKRLFIVLIILWIIFCVCWLHDEIYYAGDYYFYYAFIFIIFTLIATIRIDRMVKISDEDDDGDGEEIED